jgi:hypothetical protein
VRVLLACVERSTTRVDKAVLQKSRMQDYLTHAGKAVTRAAVLAMPHRLAAF